MAARTEQLLLSRVVQLQDFHTVDNYKITEDYFEDEQSKLNFRFIRDYYRRGGRGETIDATEAHFQRPHYAWTWTCAESIPTLCERLRTEKLRRDIVAQTFRIQQEVEIDPNNALQMWKETASNLAREHTNSDDLLFSNAGKELLERYNAVKESSGLIGIPWPWDALNQETLGLQRTHYNVIYGRPKSGKTWIGLKTAVNAFLRGGNTARERVLIYSMEMRSIEIIERLACLLGEVDFGHYRKAILHQTDPGGYARFWDWFRYLEGVKANPSYDPTSFHSDILAASDQEEGGGGIATLQAKIREFNPSLVIVDAFYLMSDDRTKTSGSDWKVVTNISRDLKKTAKQFGVALIGITQANRLSDKNPNNADLRELAYGDAIGQDADLVIRVDRKKDPGTSEREVILSLPGSRHSGTLDAFSIHFTPCTDMSQKNIIAATDPSGPPPTGQGQAPAAQGNNSKKNQGRAPQVMPNYSNPNWNKQPGKK